MDIGGGHRREGGYIMSGPNVVGDMAFILEQSHSKEENIFKEERNYLDSDEFCQ